MTAVVSVAYPVVHGPRPLARCLKCDTASLIPPVEMASFCVDTADRSDDDAVALASADAAVFQAHAGVKGREFVPSELVSEAQSRSCPFPSLECRLLHSDHLMLFVMVGDGGTVSCDLFYQCRELVLVSGLVSDFIFLLELTSLVCLTFLSLEVIGGEMSERW